MKTSYSYTILRYVHDTTTGEFVNVGVALYAPDAKYASALCRSTYGRLAKVFPGLDGDNFKQLMRFIQARLDELGARLREELPLQKSSASIMDLAHAVLPPDDSSLQWSPMGAGLTENPSDTLERLFQRLVLRYDDKPPEISRTDDDVWRAYRKPLEAKHVLKYLVPKKIAVQDDEVDFAYTWKNDVYHCLEPVSFDLLGAESIRDKAHRWLGHLQSIKNAKERFKVYMLLGEPRQPHLRSEFQKAVSILNKIEAPKELVLEDRAEEFSKKFAKKIQSHIPDPD
jgi:hypothetical protein